MSDIHKECFIFEESPHYPGKYIIRPIHENFNIKSTSGNYNVIMARLLNLSYAQYLRFCRDICQAEIIGKGNPYPIAYFHRGEMLSVLIRLLNSRANTILWEREHPNWRENQAALEQYHQNKGGRDVH